MPRKPRKLPDYFTMDEAAQLVQATESSDARLAMRLMLRWGLRVSEALRSGSLTALRPVAADHQPAGGHRREQGQDGQGDPDPR